MGTDESTPVPSAGVGWMALRGSGMGSRAGLATDLGGLDDMRCGYGCILLYDQTVLGKHKNAGGGGACRAGSGCITKVIGGNHGRETKEFCTRGRKRVFPGIKELQQSESKAHHISNIWHKLGF
ncbi:hypothetical protein GMDG_00098 [Pseudogymnoascus destructans 20631-21]|uniref:Uncharacterized protein n=1 Tax=Pseudogymnoascus destructans (strain ATCC MYA-4855 / 20631-21) TaxID=658429 RepID=L8FLB3_PSED2|nr:hypothetical protein GMDG_00098 [Pseudogymnoascus destructans 20631-21]